MQQFGNNGGVPPPPVTYLTTYQQFIADQMPKYDIQQQTSLTSENVPKNDKIILLDDRTIQKPRTLSNQYKPETNGKCIEKPVKFKVTPRKKPKRNGKCIEKTVETNSTLAKKPSLKVLEVTSPLKLTPKSNDADKEERMPCRTTDDVSTDFAMVVDNEAITAYECKICTFETIYESAFKDHMRTHKRKATFHKCPKCSFRVKCKAKIKKHVVINDGQSDKKAYCGLYAYSAECKNILDLHLNVHRNK